MKDRPMKIAIGMVSLFVIGLFFQNCNSVNVTRNSSIGNSLSCVDERLFDIGSSFDSATNQVEFFLREATVSNSRQYTDSIPAWKIQGISNSLAKPTYQFESPPLCHTVAAEVQFKNSCDQNLVREMLFLDPRCEVKIPVDPPPPEDPPIAEFKDYCPEVNVSVNLMASKPYLRWHTGYYGTEPNAYPPLYDGGKIITKLTVESTDTTAGSPLAGLTYADFGASRGGRYVTISRNKCDFTSPLMWANGFGPVYGAQAQNSGSVAFAINDPNRKGEINLTTGVWYISVVNVPGNCPITTPATACNVVLVWINGKPIDPSDLL